MKTNEIRDQLDTDEDFVYIKRFNFSLRKTLDRYPDGVPDRVLAQALLMTETDVEALYLDIQAKLKALMKVE